MNRKNLKPVAGLVIGMLLTACGAGSGNNGNNGAPAYAAVDTNGKTSSGVTSGDRVRSGAATITLSSVTTSAAPVTPAEAAHFLAQATFGPTTASINQVAASGKSSWLAAEFQKPRTLHRDYVQQIATSLATGTIVGQGQVYESFWKQAITGDDQLRQRVTYALSQIFVVSLADSNIVGHPMGVAGYYDMLAQYAFGNFRDLLQGVALHPMMGTYLSHIHNQKEAGVRVPDENFAREIMQLMTIGLYQLNQDASIKTLGGKPIETYTHDDVAGLAKVFTGWSWAGPDQTLERFFGTKGDPARDWTPMQVYPAYHSTAVKSFLGVSTPAGASGMADLKVALDTLFNHPNVGPFIGRLLIQRLVSSNPSPAYVGRVAAAFANNGAGVRGDMRAVISAVLLDPEAADTGNAKKLREPVLRLANWMRAFNAKSATGRFMLSSMDDPLSSLGQTPLRSPSVFNFFRPGYTPPNTTLSAAGMAAPEMQITGEPSVTGYLNFMQAVIGVGLGNNQDVHSDYTDELALVASAGQLVDHLNLLLLSGTMSTTLRGQIISAVNGLPIPQFIGTNTAQVDSVRKKRVYLAIYLTMVSPEYLAQR
ncbi:DUF1800 domain-containing protein [Duganella sp. LjRoot269]|uniref:DUF1800 domain-containing protein n=1 Tax=Duganella sp. LjRoot269 TaxID=3342305 RepID=UPI003ECF092A